MNERRTPTRAELIGGLALPIQERAEATRVLDALARLVEQADDHILVGRHQAGPLLLAITELGRERDEARTVAESALAVGRGVVESGKHVVTELDHVRAERDDALRCVEAAERQRDEGYREIARLRGALAREHDANCDILDVDPAIGRPTKPCNCHGRIVTPFRPSLACVAPRPDCKATLEQGPCDCPCHRGPNSSMCLAGCAGTGFIPALRCKVTKNPCGTDAWMVGKPCSCESCSHYLLRKDTFENGWLVVEWVGRVQDFLKKCAETGQVSKAEAVTIMMKTPWRR